ncbi:MAG TPA: ABC transporter ATP-binding protein [Candidatus Sumerlaeota bacterium]|nr:ABC transporter ATP-binding protein [Candidatus Sumerlaeota bacterium]HON50939.1 ABC transporter ATP-binding protein [Candidatus Sumerlaeota bacterium]HOR65633.1 ABC transporter ATP-binding protein [Candidatus Sumerlaeota bacterium]HPL74642.1 ABC transporter ATP-binding protein [Candidatus Sumerlaeota bacterium]HRU54160.1 ABC transporter ATP-binding protein [Candidatus Sumerlaeia bacterium]
MQETKNNSLIILKEIKKTYLLGSTEVNALRGINLNIDRGEYVAIMGPSGSGKSSLMHILGCLDRPSGGHYTLDGRRVDSLNDVQLSHTRNVQIGFVFQNFNLLPQMTVRENVELPMVYSGRHLGERRKISEKYIEQVKLGHRINHLPSELSGGERQRVAIARALVNDPSILMADEPTGNLDTKTGHEIMCIFDEISASGKTIILVTHEPDIAKHASRVIHILDGLVSSDERRA